MPPPKQNNILLIGLDLDGTLYNDQKVIPPHTLHVLAKALQKGVAIAPATGRPASGVPQELLALPGLRYALTSNGARVMDLAAGRPVAQFPLAPAQAVQALAILARHDCVIDLFSQGKRISAQGDEARVPLFVQPNMVQYVLSTRNPVPDLAQYALHSGHSVEKLSIFFRDEAERRRAWAELEAHPAGFVVTSSLAQNLEVNAPGVTKGKALMALAAHLGLARGQVMACGDSGNDLDMIRQAGLGVAMANATPEVLDAADYVTLSNQQQGVAAAIERFVL